MKLKTPPYAKPIIEMRKRGVHPDVVDVVYSHTWPQRPGPDDALIYIPAGEYEPNKYHFGCIAGLAVMVRVVDYNIGTPWLVSEIAHLAAWVEVRWWQRDKVEYIEDAALHLIQYRYRPEYDGIWTYAMDQAYEQRRDQLQAFYLARRAGNVA